MSDIKTDSNFVNLCMKLLNNEFSPNLTLGDEVDDDDNNNNDSNDDDDEEDEMDNDNFVFKGQMRTVCMFKIVFCNPI